MVVSDVVDSIYAGKDISKLVRTSNLYLNVLGRVHVPPVPGLQ